MTPNEPVYEQVAICDACALYSITLADLLTSLGVAGLFYPLWTHAIHAEWIRNLLEHRQPNSALTLAKLSARRDAMIAAIEDSLVEDFEDLIPTLTLPDADDRHVLAAAIKAEATLIITFNLTDFPSEVLGTYGVMAIHPDEFAAALLNEMPADVVATLRKMRARRQRPTINAEDFLLLLERQGLKKFVAALRQLNAAI
jgi:hypothetical protein